MSQDLETGDRQRNLLKGGLEPINEIEKDPLPVGQITIKEIQQIGS